MSRPSLPDPNLRQWPPISFIILYILLLLGYIPFMVCMVVFCFVGTRVFEQPIEIAIPFPSIILFISMMVPFVASIVSGYRFNSIQVSNGQEQEEWAAGLDSAFETLVQTVKLGFDLKNPVVTEEFARHAKMHFAQYLADPYYQDQVDPPLCARRLHILVIVTATLLALCFAAIPFSDGWCKPGAIPIRGSETFVQGLSCFAVVYWCHLHWVPMWKLGWVLKMGSIARQIRRECIKNGSVKGSEEDVEKSGESVDPKERLEWWIRESWKACGDGHDIFPV